MVCEKSAHFLTKIDVCIIDYAISIWSPYKQKYKDTVKNVQRRATKQLPGMKDIPYQERLERFKFPHLHIDENVEI